MDTKEIKSMDTRQLEIAATDIRAKLIDSISKTGGHLASNLGVVELTLALHRVFDTSKDKVIWDVGHQAYVHKMLTGREEMFDTLRRTDGLSGFPKTKESMHDAFDTGHSSNSVSVAFGMAAARDLAGKTHEVLAVIGDGSLTGGEAYEGLNNLGDSKTKVIVILNDNGMSIHPNTGGISNHLTKLRVSSRYYNFKGGIRKAVKKVPVIGDGLYYGASKMRDIVKYALVDGVFFEELGFTYIGPVDGHDIDKLTETFRAAKNSEKSCVIHVITKKGKGYRNAENNPDVFHGTGPFDATTGKPKKCSEQKTFSEYFGMKMVELAGRDKRVAAITAAMTDGVGLTHFRRSFPDRFFDVGIAEQHAVSFAAGLAAQGMKPVVAIYSSFLQRAYDQIIMDCCLMELPVVFALDRAGIVGADGETHQGIFDISYMAHIPNLTIMAPRDGTELGNMLEEATKMDSPVCIRYPRGTSCDTGLEHKPVSEGAQMLRDGNDVTLISAGGMASAALEAASILENKNLSCRVIDARIIKPLDAEQIHNHVSDSKLVVSLEDNVVTGGLGSMIQDLIPEVLKLGWPQQFIEHGSPADLYKRYGLDPEGIAERIGEAFERKA